MTEPTEQPELTEEQVRIEELTRSLLQVQADFANYKRRTEEQREQEKQRATKRLVGELLTIIDNLELALKQEAGEKTDFHKGVELIFSQLISVLEDNGVKHIPTETFDPTLHEALLSEPSELEKGSIIEVLQSGYSLGGLVLRTAKVKVSSGPQEEKENE